MPVRRLITHQLAGAGTPRTIGKYLVVLGLVGLIDLIDDLGFIFTTAWSQRITVNCLVLSTRLERQLAASPTRQPLESRQARHPVFTFCEY